MAWPKTALLFLATGFLVGCGSDGPRREDFVARADERCRNILASFPREQEEPGNPSESAELNRRRAESYRRFHEELRRLEPPDAMAGDFGQFLDRTERQARNRDEYAAAVAAGDPVQQRYLDEEFRAINETKRDLRPKLGFRSC